MRPAACLIALILACHAGSSPPPADGGQQIPEPPPLSQCPPGPPAASCDGVRVDLDSDSDNCGACGNRCAAGGACGVGLCWNRGDTPQCSAASRPAAGTWTELGPPLSGRIDGIAPGIGNVDRVLVGSPGGGIWSTQSGGAVWAKMGGLADDTVLHLARDRSDPARLYALTVTDLYVSADEGQNWTNLTGTGGHPRPASSARNSDPYAFAQLLPRSGGSVILWAFHNSGLFYSTDGGKTVQRTAQNADGDIISVAADDATGRIYYSTSGDLRFNGDAHARVFRSDASWTGAGPPPGVRWELVSSGLPQPPDSILLAWAGQADQLVAVATGGSTTVYTSNNGGLAWLPSSPLGSTATWDVRAVLVPEPNRVLVGAVTSFETLDVGAHWSSFWISNLHADVRSLVLQDGNVWEGSDGTFSLPTYANLARWRYSPSAVLSLLETVPTSGRDRMHTWQAYYALVSGSTLYVGSQDNGGMCADDFGAIWSAQNGSNGCGDLIAMAIAPSNPARAYAQTCDPGSILRTDNAGAGCATTTWTPISGSYYTSSVHWSRHMLAVDPLDADHLAVTEFSDVAISKDGGAHESIWALSAITDRPSAVLYDPTGALWVGTQSHGVYRTTDDGSSSTNIRASLGTSMGPVFALAWSPAGGAIGTIYAGAEEGLFRSAIGGSLERVLGGSGYAVSEVAVDPGCPTRIYAGFGFKPPSVHRGGLAMSVDGGTSWSSLSAGTDVHRTPVTSVQVDPRDSTRVYVATYGRGAWLYKHPSLPACL